MLPAWWISGLGGKGFGQGYSEGASAVRCACDRNVATVGPGNCASQTEPQPDSCLGPALIAPIKPLKNARKVLRRDADAGIFERDKNLGLVFADVDMYRPAGLRIFDGIV